MRLVQMDICLEYEPGRRTEVFTRRRWIIIRCLFKLSENNFPNYSESILVASAKSSVQREAVSLLITHGLY